MGGRMVIGLHRTILVGGPGLLGRRRRRIRGLRFVVRRIELGLRWWLQRRFVRRRWLLRWRGRLGLVTRASGPGLEHRLRS